MHRTHSTAMRYVVPQAHLCHHIPYIQFSTLQGDGNGEMKMKQKILKKWIYEKMEQYICGSSTQSM